MAVLALLLAGVMSAQAQFDVLPEIRVGGMAHDVGTGAGGLFDPVRFRDVNAELLFSIPMLDGGPVGAIRPHIGTTMNFGGQESLFYAGLSYTAQLPVVPLFVEASVGAAGHAALFASTTPAARFGCAALARGSASVGLNVIPGASIIATVEHYTDFGACGMANTGETNVGLRVGFRF
ncbi:acyloxyacyl hydrolase [Devosia sp.]|uniref:acyloxyacyl hydrolase n=1 Tax=Devosia sp. TaxID=1871048 RepID=UPI00326470FD